MKHHRAVRQGMGSFTMLFDEIDYSDKKIQVSALPCKNNYPFHSK